MTLFAKAIKRWIDTKFTSYGGKFAVESEKTMFRKMEDKSIWEQHKDLRPEGAEIYLQVAKDRWEYVADVRSNEPESIALIKVTNGLERIKKQLEKEVTLVT